MMESKVFADNFSRSFSESGDFFQFLSARQARSKWMTAPSKELRFEPVERGSTLGNLYMQIYDHNGDADVLEDTMENTSLLLKVDGKDYPVRSCALKTVLERARISGHALNKVSKSVFAEILNYCMGVASGDSLIKVADEKVSAVHGGDPKDYTVMEMLPLFKATNDFLDREYPGNRFMTAHFDHSIATAIWCLDGQADKLLDTYHREIAAKGLRADKLVPALRFSTSDVGMSGANLYPIFLAGAESRIIPLGYPIRTEHKNGSGMEYFEEQLGLVYAQFEKAVDKQVQLMNIEIRYPVTTLHFIAKTLNEQGVPSPGRYLYDIGLRKTEKFKNAIWYLQTIKKILVDPVYLGWIVSGKYRSQLCERGTKTTVKTPEEEWIINKGMHEPIVSKELFDKVQDILSARQSEQGLATIYDSKSKRRSMFKGILRCGECGRSMYLRSKSNRGYYYYCTLHENYNATICPKKAVKQEDVESLALRLIQTQIRAFSDAQRLIANLNATPSSQTRYQIYETQIDDAKRKIEKFNQLKAALYGDFADGLLSHQDYTDLSEDYSRRADDLRIFIAELEKEKEKYSVGFGSKMQWALLIEKYKDQESLDAEMAAAFIETLTLFNDGHVEVAFRHRDEIEQVLYVAATRGKEAERYAG